MIPLALKVILCANIISDVGLKCTVLPADLLIMIIAKQFPGQSSKQH